MNAAAAGMLYMLLGVLQIAIAGASAQAPPPPRTLLRAGYIATVCAGAEPAAQTIIMTGSTPKPAARQEGDIEIEGMEPYGNLPVMEDASAVEAIEAGVKAAPGTGAAVYPRGLSVHAADVYVSQLGRTPLAPIQTPTIRAAGRIAWTSRTGTLEAGKPADGMAVDGDPLLKQGNFATKSGAEDETHTQQLPPTHSRSR
jgi:hypothetical protein